MKKENVKKWETPNGNVCFSFPMHKAFERPWMMITVLVLASTILCIELYLWKSHNLLYPSIIFLIMFFFWWVDIPAWGNEAIISNTVREIMTDTVNEDATVAGVRVVKILVNHDYHGTYGLIEASCLLVLLDNGEVWEYPIIYHDQDKQGVFFECVKEYFVCKNMKHIRKINPKRLKRIISSIKLSEKTCLGLLLLVILIVGGVFFAGFCWVIKEIKLWLLLVVVSIFAIYSLTEWLYSRWPSKILGVIRTIESIPIVIVYLVLQSGIPFITIVGTYFFVLLFAFGVPSIFFAGVLHIGWLVLKPETIVFVVFAMGSIICSSSYRTNKWIIHHSPFRDWGNHTYESYREALAFYLIQPSNVVFLLYTVYFVFLSVSGYLQIQKESYLISEGFDASILKAFLVFIAFTNMRTKSKEADLDTKELFRQTLYMFVNH